MKKVIFVLLAIFLGITSLCQAADDCIPSGSKSSSAAITSTASTFCGIAVFTDGSHDAVFSVYDNTTGAGTVVFGPATLVGSSNLGGIVGVSIPMQNGIYVSISGTGATYIVYYRQRR